MKGVFAAFLMANTFAFIVLLIKIFHNSYWNKIRDYITGV
jgi:hypothetical protein